jgi:hypothetical protein
MMAMAADGCRLASHGGCAAFSVLLFGVHEGHQQQGGKCTRVVQGISNAFCSKDAGRKKNALAAIEGSEMLAVDDPQITLHCVKSRRDPLGASRV